MKEINSAENERFKAFSRLCKDKKERDAAGVCVVDGVKLCADIHEKGFTVKELWMDEEASEKYNDVLRRFIADAEEIFILGGNAAKRLSDLKAPQGVFALVERPSHCDVSGLEDCSRVLGLCEIQNPENTAAAIRTAAALGYDGVLVTDDCADVWSPRAIRAGAGAQFGMKICVSSDMPADISVLNSYGFYSLASALRDETVEVQNVGKKEKLFVAVGNEGHGLPAEVIDACTDTVMIPMSGAVESLNANAAASILMWQLRSE